MLKGVGTQTEHGHGARHHSSGKSKVRIRSPAMGRPPPNNASPPAVTDTTATRPAPWSTILSTCMLLLLPCIVEGEGYGSNGGACQLDDLGISTLTMLTSMSRCKDAEVFHLSVRGCRGSRRICLL